MVVLVEVCISNPKVLTTQMKATKQFFPVLFTWKLSKLVLWIKPADLLPLKGGKEKLKSRGKDINCERKKFIQLKNQLKR